MVSLLSLLETVDCSQSLAMWNEKSLINHQSFNTRELTNKSLAVYIIPRGYICFAMLSRLFPNMSVWQTSHQDHYYYATPNFKQGIVQNIQNCQCLFREAVLYCTVLYAQ